MLDGLNVPNRELILSILREYFRLSGSATTDLKVPPV